MTESTFNNIYLNDQINKAFKTPIIMENKNFPQSTNLDKFKYNTQRYRFDDDLNNYYSD